MDKTQKVSPKTAIIAIVSVVVVAGLIGYMLFLKPKSAVVVAGDQRANTGGMDPRKMLPKTGAIPGGGGSAPSSSNPMRGPMPMGGGGPMGKR